MKMEDFRATLRELRRARVGSQRALSVRTKDSGPTPIAAMTISEIETGANAEPGILTVARLVDGLGLTLSSFFAEIETRGAGHGSGKAASGGTHAVPAITLDAPPDLEELGRALARFVHAVARQQTPTPRPPRPPGRAGHRKTRGRRAAGT